MTKEELKALARKYKKMPKVVEKHDGVLWMICPVCGRTFCRVGYAPWAYKIESCSFDRYSCMRQAEEVIEAAKSRRGKKNQ